MATNTLDSTNTLDGSISNLVNAARENQKAAGIVSDNLAASSDPTARAINSEIKRKDDATLAVELTLSRGEDPYLEKCRVQKITDLSGKIVCYDMLNSLKGIIGGGEGNTKSSISESINDFFASANTLESDSSNAMRHKLLNAGVNISNEFTKASDKIEELKTQADNDFHKAVNETNASIKSPEFDS